MHYPVSMNELRGATNHLKQTLKIQHVIHLELLRSPLLRGKKSNILR
jgi:hypothetical protein